MYSAVFLFLFILGPGKYTNSLFHPKTKIMKLLWYFIAFVAGSFLPIQAGLNSNLGKAITSPVYASMISFIIGVLQSLFIFLFQNNLFHGRGLKQRPGIFGWAVLWGPST